MEGRILSVLQNNWAETVKMGDVGGVETLQIAGNV